MLDDAIRADLRAHRRDRAGRSVDQHPHLDDRTWIVAYSAAESPVEYYRYDRDGAARQLTHLFSGRPALAGKPLEPMWPLELESRDGKTLVSYLTLPAHADADGDGKADSPVPLVLLVHGGPWARDAYGYSGWQQWLANRGYAVLSVNYRGSTGFGKDFTNAGDGEWAAGMHDDLIDAVQWAVERGHHHRRQVAIMGGSYGGAPLVGTSSPRTPSPAASTSSARLTSIPCSHGAPYRASFYKQLVRRI